MSDSSQENQEKGVGGESSFPTKLESLPIPICHLLPDGTLTSFNQAFSDHFKIEPQSLVGGSYLHLFPVETRPIIENMVLSLTADDPIISSLVSYNTRDQVTHWERWMLQGIFDAADQLVKIQALGYDLDVRGLSVSTASQYAQQLSSLHTATQLLLSNLDLEALLGQILDAAIDAIPGAENGALYLNTSNVGEIEIQNVLESIQNEPRIRTFPHPGNSGYLSPVLRNRIPLRIDSLQSGSASPNNQGERPAEDLQEGTPNSVIAAPLLMGSQLLGAISIESKQRSAFTNADLHLLQNFTALTALAIRNFHFQMNVQRSEMMDSLTKTYNRRGFYAMGEREIQRALRFERPLSVILLDIDDFKQINAEHGQIAGDATLQAASEQIQNHIRKVDIVGRYGGDEFILLLPETDLFGAAAVAERVRTHIGNIPVQYGEARLKVTVCLGIVKFIPKQESLDRLFERAEEAVQLAKQAGRNRVEIR